MKMLMRLNPCIRRINVVFNINNYIFINSTKELNFEDGNLSSLP